MRVVIGQESVRVGMWSPETHRRFPAAPSMTDHMVRIIKIAIYLKLLALYRAIEMMIRIFYLRQI